MLLDASGLQASSKGWRIEYSGEKRSITDEPFAETKDLIAGYTLIRVQSREEALELTKRFPNPAVYGNDHKEGSNALHVDGLVIPVPKNWGLLSDCQEGKSIDYVSTMTRERFTHHIL